MSSCVYRRWPQPGVPLLVLPRDAGDLRCVSATEYDSTASALTFTLCHVSVLLLSPWQLGL